MLKINKTFIYFIISNKFYNIYSPISFFLNFIPLFILSFLCRIFKLQIIYKIKNKYYILPKTSCFIIVSCILFETNTFFHNKKLQKRYDLTNEIINYDSNIPLCFFLTNNNANDYVFMKINYMEDNIIKEKIIAIEDYYLLSIYDIIKSS